MFYSVEVFGFSLYQIFLALGFISALIVLRIYADKKDMGAKYQNFYLITGIISIVAGYFSGILFQGFYDWMEKGVFTFNRITFLGGLIGGSTVFILIYLIFSRFVFKEKQMRESFAVLLQCAPCCIVFAHALGRIGCLCAGCCYGKRTNSFLGVFTPYENFKVVPLQLFEAIFLFLLFIILSILYFKNIKINFSIYLIAYGIWRFVVEFFRGDERGESIVSFFSPSQLIAVIMVFTGTIILTFKIYNWKLKSKLKVKK